MAKKSNCNVCGTPSCKKHPCYPVYVKGCPTLADGKEATPIPDCITDVEYCSEGCASTLEAKCIILSDGRTLQQFIDEGGFTIPVDPDVCDLVEPNFTNANAVCFDPNNTEVTINLTADQIDPDQLAGVLFLLFGPDENLIETQGAYTLLANGTADFTFTLPSVGDYDIFISNTSTAPKANSVTELIAWLAVNESCRKAMHISFTVAECNGTVNPNCNSSGTATGSGEIDLNIQ